MVYMRRIQPAQNVPLEEKVVFDFANFFKLHCFLLVNMGCVKSTGIYCNGMLPDISLLGFSSWSDLAEGANHVARTSRHASMLRHGGNNSLSSKL